MIPNEMWVHCPEILDYNTIAPILEKNSKPLKIWLRNFYERGGNGRTFKYFLFDIILELPIFDKDPYGEITIHGNQLHYDDQGFYITWNNMLEFSFEFQRMILDAVSNTFYGRVLKSGRDQILQDAIKEEIKAQGFESE